MLNIYFKILKKYILAKLKKYILLCKKYKNSNNLSENNNNSKSIF